MKTVNFCNEMAEEIAWQRVCNKRDNNKIAFEQFFHQTSPSFKQIFLSKKRMIS